MEKCRFSRSVLTKKCGNRAGLNGKTCVLKNFKAIEGLVDIFDIKNRLHNSLEPVSTKKTVGPEHNHQNQYQGIDHHPKIGGKGIWNIDKP